MSVDVHVVGTSSDGAVCSDDRDTLDDGQTVLDMHMRTVVMTVVHW